MIELGNRHASSWLRTKKKYSCKRKYPLESMRSGVLTLKNQTRIGQDRGRNVYIPLIPNRKHHPRTPPIFSHLNRLGFRQLTTSPCCSQISDVGRPEVSALDQSQSFESRSTEGCSRETSWLGSHQTRLAGSYPSPPLTVQQKLESENA